MKVVIWSNSFDKNNVERNENEDGCKDVNDLQKLKSDERD